MEGGADVWQHETIPMPLRVQIARAISSATKGIGSEDTRARAFKFAVDALRDDAGRNELVRNNYGYTYEQEFKEFVEGVADTDQLLDAIEYWIDACRKSVRGQTYGGSLSSVSNIIPILNSRFKEAGVGYQIEDGQVIKVSDKLLHQEAVTPALRILASAKYDSANSEFRIAFESFKSGHYEDCLVGCCKALESVLKVIGGLQGWGLDGTEPLATLITKSIDKELIPKYMLAQFTGLRSSLGAVGTIRNKDGGHGAGEVERNVPEHLAAYQLHLTASAIVFLEACARS
ncbi:MAG: hypothetical protein KGJ57_09250 [Sphingomonadales bacterium]|nr:hypothetical protein [Sphingomonadales bacterium]MDE2169596.1 hypothetical protein [Sphingomonadales bacterium]